MRHNHYPHTTLKQLNKTCKPSCSNDEIFVVWNGSCRKFNNVHVDMTFTTQNAFSLLGEEKLTSQYTMSCTQMWKWDAVLSMYTHVYTCTCLHDFNNLHELVHVFPGRHEALQHQEFEVVIHVAANASHHLHIHVQYYINFAVFTCEILIHAHVANSIIRICDHPQENQA